ncbi:YggT family protein [Rhodoferax sp. OV413]|uniref:YggT family protein n=1 Tax=Rhodoferax sp. OV413 TaxID=1855285 RepID=UPI0008873199|nr:YggT family protein [Rhodoferax sp. OV413]SDP17442.1 YggT family protein [Rhodoferax sp. OV413]
MLYQIISFLLEVATGLVGGACLLRLYMQYQRIPFRNPVGSLVFALTDWLILPLRRVLPAVGRWDVASLVAPFLLKLLQFLLLWLLAGGTAGWLAIPVLALFGVVSLTISGLTGMLLIYSVLSWMQTRSPLSDVLERLCAPLLLPVRRIVPPIGGLDLSALVLLVLLQVVAIVIGYALPAVLAQL